MSSPITARITDTMHGRPAVGLSVALERENDDDSYEVIAQGVTDEDGAVNDLLGEGSLSAGVYLMHFDTEGYFVASGVESLYPSIAVLFRVPDPNQQYHISLLLSPYGYTIYRTGQ